MNTLQAPLSTASSTSLHSGHSFFGFGAPAPQTPSPPAAADTLDCILYATYHSVVRCSEAGSLQIALPPVKKRFSLRKAQGTQWVAFEPASALAAHPAMQQAGRQIAKEMQQSKALLWGPMADARGRSLHADLNDADRNPGGEPLVAADVWGRILTKCGLQIARPAAARVSAPQRNTFEHALRVSAFHYLTAIASFFEDDDFAAVLPSYDDIRDEKKSTAKTTQLAVAGMVGAAIAAKAFCAQLTPGEHTRVSVRQHLDLQCRHVQDDNAAWGAPIALGHARLRQTGRFDLFVEATHSQTQTLMFHVPLVYGRHDVTLDASEDIVSDHSDLRFTSPHALREQLVDTKFVRADVARWSQHLKV